MTVLRKIKKRTGEKLTIGHRNGILNKTLVGKE